MTDSANHALENRTGPERIARTEGPKVAKQVVVGLASFIGLEVAASLRLRGLCVTSVAQALRKPLTRIVANEAERAPVVPAGQTLRARTKISGSTEGVDAPQGQGGATAHIPDM